VDEFFSLLTGFFNTVVAGVGAWIAVTQWRASRAKPAVTAPPPRAPAAPARLPAPPPPAAAVEPPAGRKLARAASVAVAAGAGTAVFSALTDFVYWLQKSSDDEQGSLLVFLASVTYLTALLLGLFVLVAGLVKRRKRIARLGLLAVVLSQTLWLAMWLTAAM
jgi:apolipoprotein N-acyltransferase